MIEKKVELRKGNVTKLIDENIVSLYLNMGWKKVDGKNDLSSKSKEQEGIKKTSIKGL